MQVDFLGVFMYFRLVLGCVSVIVLLQKTCFTGAGSL